MKIYSFNQVNILKSDLEFDVMIASTGYESRSSFLAKQNINVKKKIVLAFKDHKAHEVRLNNDLLFKTNHFEFIKDIEGSDAKRVLELIDSIISEHSLSVLSILIDYSSMTRIWYGAIIHYFRYLKLNEKKRINVYFSYSVAKFLPPSTEAETINFYPIKYFCNLSLPTKPTALISGLGFEKKRVFGLREYFDAEALYLFYTEKNEFTKYVLEKNKEVLASVKENQIFPYDITDLNYTKMLLHDLCESLKNKFRIIIAPCGPKPFTLLSFLIACNIPNIDVWRISASDNEDVFVDRIENGEIITLEVKYEN